MAREFFKNYPNTTTPLEASRLNGLLDGDEAMGNIIVDSIEAKNLFNINGEININGFSGTIGSYNTVSSNTITCNGNSSSSQYYGQKFTDMNGQTFTLSAKLVSKGTGEGGRIAIFDNGTFKTEKQLGTVGGYQSITYTGTSDNVVVAFCTAGGTGAQLTDIQVEKGSSATTYTAYQGVGYVSGQNSNGNYIKYDDGTMICYNTINKTNFLSSSSISTTVQGIKIYRSNAYTWIFPISFINADVKIQALVCNGINGSRFALARMNGNPTSIGVAIQLLGLEDFTQNEVGYTNLESVSVMAIGRWK